MDSKLRTLNGEALAMVVDVWLQAMVNASGAVPMEKWGVMDVLSRCSQAYIDEYKARVKAGTPCTHRQMWGYSTCDAYAPIPPVATCTAPGCTHDAVQGTLCQWHADFYEEFGSLPEPATLDELSGEEFLELEPEDWDGEWDAVRYQDREEFPHGEFQDGSQWRGGNW